MLAWVGEGGGGGGSRGVWGVCLYCCFLWVLFDVCGLFRFVWGVLGGGVCLGFIIIIIIILFF